MGLIREKSGEQDGDLNFQWKKTQVMYFTRMQVRECSVKLYGKKSE